MGTQFKNTHHNTPITNFYKNKSVFLTGATGFLGTILLEKLLHSCPGVKTIYILLKSKKNLSAKERLELLLKTVPFKRLQEQKSAVFSKIVLINGDLTNKNIGINDEDLEMLQKNVSIVFHLAAIINFDLSVAEAVNINTLGTRRVLEFSRTILNLEALIYVSTAYCSVRGNNDITDEKIYSTSTSVQSALHAINHDTSNSLVNSLIEGRPNCYTYSKALTEQLIENEFSDLPIAVVRPSIIVSSFNEPVAGWVQGWAGSNGVILMQSLSLLRVWNADYERVVDIIPVDFVANILIAAAWDAYNKQINDDGQIKVLNISSGLRNPLTIRQFFDITSRHIRKHCKNGALIPQTITIIKNTYLFSICFFFLQTIPTYIIDGLCLILRQQPRLLINHKRIIKMLLYLKFFTLNQFLFIDRNVRELYSMMDDDDQAIFNFNVDDIDWESFLEHYVFGLTKYVARMETML